MSAPDEPQKPFDPEEARRINQELKQQIAQANAKNWQAAVAREREKQQVKGTNQEPFSPHVEGEASRILGDSDIDREAAELLRGHHADKLDKAIDAGDKNAALSVGVTLGSHREATEMLRKPKDHFVRQEFERRQAERAEQDRGNLRQ